MRFNILMAFYGSGNFHRTDLNFSTDGIHFVYPILQSVGLFPCVNANYIVTAPILRIYSTPHICVKTGMRPIRHSAYPSMLNRIPMDIIDVMFEIFFITDQVLPESALPYTALALF